MTNPVVLWIANLLGVYPGFVIVVLTVMVIFGVVFVVFNSDRMEQATARFLNRQSQTVRAVLLLPAVVLWIFFRLIDIFAFICALVTGYQVATGVRNWWNRRG